MEREERRINVIQEQIARLPKGNITYRMIRGARRMYLQWTENGKKTSRYIRKEDEASVLESVNARKQLEEELRLFMYARKLSGRGVLFEHAVGEKYETKVTSGAELGRMCAATQGCGYRDCYAELADYLARETDGKVCIIYGLRRTGKTFMIRQAIRTLPLDETVYIKIRSTDDMAALNRDLLLLSRNGIRYVFIDEVTLMSDFIDSASLLSDIYASSGMRIVLSGTNSLGFMLSLDDELYDRAVTIHTTLIPFREYARLLGIREVDEYIRYGGTFRVGELDFDDEDLLDEGASFRDDETTRRYIDTSIARNIQHSLTGYRAGGHFRHLTDLYEAGELTNVINRLIEDMNHRFLLSVLNCDFTSHDLGSAGQIDRKWAAAAGEKGSLDEASVIDKLKRILEIKNREEMTIDISEDHIREIRQYLYMLDLIVDAPTETIGSMRKIERILFSQPGMRYCQAQALVFSLMSDDQFIGLPAKKRKALTDLILAEVKGRMLEEIVLLETIKALPRGKRAFKLQFDAGEYDMVVYDENEVNCRIYEIKHSGEIDRDQYRHLIDKKKNADTEFQYGDITGRVVLYNGKETVVEGVEYRNIAAYLEGLGRGKRE